MIINLSINKDFYDHDKSYIIYLSLVLSFVIYVLKEFTNDYRRKKNDEKINNNSTLVTNLFNFNL